MASVLTHSKSIEDINFFISECKLQTVEVLGPDINESKMNFYATKTGKIRFGMSAVKGVGEGPVEEILRARESGNFTDIYDVVRRVSLRVANKKSFESLSLSGAFDAFGYKRASFFAPFDDKTIFLEAVLRYGNAYQKEQTETTMSLFGDSAEDSTLPEPKLPDVEEWPLMQRLKKEKDVTGFYLSGHPLDDYKVEVQRFATPINKLEEYRDQELALVGIVTDVQHRMSKKGSPFGSFSIEDYESTYQVSLFGENYMRFKHLLVLDAVVYVKGKYSPKWSDPNSYEMRINEIRLLDEVRNEKIKGITINVPVQSVTEKFIVELDDICQKHGGDQTLSVNILDVSEKIKLHLISFNRKINADSLFVASLERMGIDYKLS
jgi:DNA polymerase-3 subunit alpha